MIHMLSTLSAEGIAAIITALGALIAALQGKRQSKKAADVAQATAAQFQPDHGTSAIDKIDLLVELSKEHGERISSMNTDIQGLRRDVSVLQESHICG